MFIISECVTMKDNLINLFSIEIKESNKKSHKCSRRVCILYKIMNKYVKQMILKNE